MDKRLTPWMAWSHEGVGFWPTQEWAEKDAQQMIADGSRGVIVARVVMQSVVDSSVEVLQPVEEQSRSAQVEQPGGQ